MSLSRLRRAAGVLFSIALLAIPGPVIAEEGDTPEHEFIWPTTGRITQPYGCTGFYLEPRRGSCPHFHGGIDIADTRGTPIRAVADGVVTHVGWDRGVPRRYSSWLVIIDHGGGIQSLYFHLRDRDLTSIERGKRVRKGQVIGLMDTTGMSTGPHLHFAVRRNGIIINPREFLTGQPNRGPRRPPEGSTIPEQAECWRPGAGYGAHNGALTAARTESEAGPNDCAA